MTQQAEVMEAEIVDEPVAVTVRRDAVAGLIRPIAKPADVLEAQNQTRELIQQTLTDGRDYDTIPGTKKPTLLKPGAERVAAAFGCATRYRIIEQEIDHDRPVAYVKRSWAWGEQKGEKIWSEAPGESRGLYRYVLLCQLVHRESGVVIGEGVGSCSTMESKYIDRPRDVENTILKMAKKRAFVDATLTTFGLSEQFTQDVEDMEHGARSNGSAQENGNGNGHSKPAQATQPFSLDQAVGFGKHKATTWRALLAKAPDYVSWAIGNATVLTDEAKRVLAGELEDHDVKYPKGQGGEKRPAVEKDYKPPVAAGHVDDDLPF